MYAFFLNPCLRLSGPPRYLSACCSDICQAVMVHFESHCPCSLQSASSSATLKLIEHRNVRTLYAFYRQRKAACVMLNSASGQNFTTPFGQRLLQKPMCLMVSGFNAGVYQPNRRKNGLLKHCNHHQNFR